MPIDIKAFKNVSANSSLASIKIDKANSSRDEVVLKASGAGKTDIGKLVRRNESWLGKAYAFFKDPSGSANKSLRQEFVKAFQREFKQDISGIVNPKSREPLNVELVQQLIKNAENKAPTPNVTFGGSKSVQHSTNVTAEKIEDAATRFMRIGETKALQNGSGALAILGNLEEFHNKEAEKRTKSSDKIEYLESDYDKTRSITKAFDGEFKSYSDLAYLSGAMSHYSKLSNNENRRERINPQTIGNFLPPNLLKNSGLKIDALENISVKFSQLDQLVKSFRDERSTESSFREIGKQILTITGDIYKQLDETLNFLIDKETRKTVESFGDTEAGKEMYPLDNAIERREKTVDKYDFVVQSLLKTRNAICNPESGFQGLVALGLLLSGAPERGYEFQK